MRVNKYLLLPLILSLAACAGSRAVSDKNAPTEFVEISNPGFTMTRDAPATIWVPRSSVENGPLRGGEVVKKAYEKVTDRQSGAAVAETSVPVYPATPVVAVAQSNPSGMRSRAIVFETGNNQLAIPFKEKLRGLPNSPVIAIAPEAAADRLQSRDERAAYAVKAWQDSGVNVALFVLAPEGLTSGRYLSVEMYDGMGAGLVSKLEAVIPTYDAKDPAALNAAVASSLALLAEKSRDAITLLPWYARIVAVDAGKIYLNAGREAGINMGQKLTVLRGGKVVTGLGFAPGTVVGTVEVSGFVGSNGATATAKDSIQIYPSDLIAVH